MMCFIRMPPAKCAAGLRQTAENECGFCGMEGKRDYAIKPLHRLTAGGRSMVVRLRCRVGKGIFYIAVASVFMFLKFLKPLIIF